MRKLLILISIVAASMFATARAAEPTVLYERGGDGTAWSDADLEEWVNDNTAVTQTRDNGLKVLWHGSEVKSSWNSTKDLEFKKNSIVTLTGTISGGNAAGHASSYTFFELGEIQIRLYGNSQKSSVDISGTETTFSNYTRGGTYNFTITVDQATKDVSVEISGNSTGSASGKITSDLPDKIIFGHQRGGNEGNWDTTETLKSIKITEEEQEVKMASYTVNYICDGTTIKSETGSIAVGTEVSATSPLTINDQKYYFADGATTSITIQDGSDNVLNVEMREAYVYNYTVSNNVNDVVKTGTCVEGETITVPYNRYILKDGILYETNANNNEYRLHQTLDADFETTLNYTPTNVTDGIYFVEAEDITGIEITTRTDASVDIRCSNGAGGIAKDEPIEVYTLAPGKYKVTLGLFGNATQEYTVIAGDVNIFSAATAGGLKEFTSDEFSLTEPTKIYISGGWSNKPLDYILITGEVAKPVTGVTINDKDGKAVETLEMTEDENYQLYAVIEPENADVQTATWSSSNEEIVTVSATGVVTALKAGEATITATAGEKSASCVVTVKASEIVVTALSLDKTEATVAVGGEIELKATVEPAAANVAWTSDNSEVATVENGKVTAVAAGTAVITAKAGSMTATCTVTVTVPVSGITLSMEKFTVDKGDEFTLVATVAPEDATDTTVTWSSDKPEFATVDENGKVTAVAAGEAVITATAGEQTASCTVTVDESEAKDGVVVKMTYVNKDEPNKAFGKILAGESAKSGYNKISGGKVDWANTGYGVDFVTYIQVDASAIEDKYITSATLTFDASGSTDSRRSTGWGVGYNSSKWSSTMTFNDADLSITELGETKPTTTKSATTFENFSFDITDAINNAEGRIVTILVYETAAAGGYIKNPTVAIESTNELVYNVTFAAKNVEEDVKVTVTVNEKDATEGITLPNGTYTFTATALHYKDYEGEFTVADAEQTVEFEMTKKEVWSYTVNAVDAEGKVLKELSSGEEDEEENVTYYFPGYYLQGNTLLSKAHNSSNPYYGNTEKLDSNGKVFEVVYNGTPISNVVFYKEAEEMDGFTSRNTNSAPIRCSNGLGGTAEGDVLLVTLPAGTYSIHGQVWGSNGLTAGVKIKAASEGEEDTVLWTLKSTGSLTPGSSEDFTLSAETELYVYTTDGNDKRMLDYIYITKSVIDVTGITLDKTEATLTMGESLDLVATVTPDNATDKTITWASDNEDVATVVDGKVTTLKYGTAKITATCGTFSATCALTVNPKLGDVNYDGGVDVADATDITNYVVGKKTVTDAAEKVYYEFAANVNKDEDHRITFADASAAIDLILDQPASEETENAMRVASYDNSTDALMIGNAIAKANGKFIVPVTLANTESYVALQADIILPEGFNIDVVAGSRVADTHTLSTRKYSDNHIRIVLFNLGSIAFAENDAPLFEIVADGSISASDDIEISNIVASDSDANRYVLASKSTESTGVAAIGLDPEAPVKVFDMNGIYVGDKMTDLRQGTYIVRQGEVAKKIRIR